MPDHASVRLGTTSGWVVIAAFVAALFLGAGEASAVDLNVNPKKPKTVSYSSDGNPSSNTVKYKLNAVDGRKVRWKLKSYPNWLVPDAISGKAKKKRKKLVLAVDAAVIETMERGIYTSAIKFKYRNGKKKRKIRRTVILVVEGDPAVGRDLFVGKCSGCHDLFMNKSGPYLGDVYGRVAGTAGGFNYSDAIVDYGKVWEEENLNDWLKNTQKLVPGAAMYLKVGSEADRMNIIAYLKAISP
jgi:cytochrome c